MLIEATTTSSDFRNCQLVHMKYNTGYNGYLALDLRQMELAYML